MKRNNASKSVKSPVSEPTQKLIPVSTKSKDYKETLIKLPIRDNQV
jgi:hypothetical protein